MLNACDIAQDRQQLYGAATAGMLNLRVQVAPLAIRRRIYFATFANNIQNLRATFILTARYQQRETLVWKWTQDQALRIGQSTASTSRRLPVPCGGPPFHVERTAIDPATYPSFPTSGLDYINPAPPLGDDFLSFWSGHDSNQAGIDNALFRVTAAPVRLLLHADEITVTCESLTLTTASGSGTWETWLACVSEFPNPAS